MKGIEPSSALSKATPVEQGGDHPSAVHLGKPLPVVESVELFFGRKKERRECGQLEEADKFERARRKGLERGQVEVGNETPGLERKEPLSDVAPALVEKTGQDETRMLEEERPLWTRSLSL